MKSINWYKIKYALFSKQYRWYSFLWFFLFLLVNYFVNEVNVIGFQLFNFSWYIYTSYLFFTFLNAGLVSLTINLIIQRFRELNSMSGAGSATSVGTVGTFLALLTGACPGCIAGLVPAIAGLFGSSLNLTQLPLGGLEIQVLSTILLIVGSYLLSQDITCNMSKPKAKTKKNSKK